MCIARHGAWLPAPRVEREAAAAATAAAAAAELAGGAVVVGGACRRGRRGLAKAMATFSFAELLIYFTLSTFGSFGTPVLLHTSLKIIFEDIATIALRG